MCAMPSVMPRYIAHRCGGVLAPENTLAGLQAAAACGFGAVEFDVMLSADGTPVLIHDETLERTTNGLGRVCDTRDQVLFSLDAGNGESVPRLAEAASLCRRLRLMANVEIKPAAGYEARTAETVARFVAESWGDAPPPLLSSFSLESLAAARRVAPFLRYGLLFEVVPPDWPALHRQLGTVSLHCDAETLTDEVIAEATALSVPVLAYTVNDCDAARTLFARGLSGIFTDRPDLFCKQD